MMRGLSATLKCVAKAYSAIAMTLELLAIPLLIFCLRVTNNVIGTVRLILVSRGRRAWSFGFAALESLLFAYTAGQVITDLENLPKLAAYVLGFAVGGFVGVQVENRFVKAYECVTRHRFAGDGACHGAGAARRGARRNGDHGRRCSWRGRGAADYHASA